MTMDGLDRWGVRIARYAAPDERDFAGHVTRAYAAGGAARRDLFRTAGHAPGGIGGGLATVLPDLLDALAYAAEAVKAALGSQQFGNAISATALLISLRAQAGSRDAVAATAPPPGAEPPRRAQSAPERPEREQPERPTAQPSAAGIHAALRLRDRLKARGLDDAEAETFACDLLAGLLADPEPAEAAAFLDRLVAVEPPAPLVPGARRSSWPRARLLRAAARLSRRRPGPDHPDPPDPPDDA